MKTVYFDEAGNTGADLSNAQQPVFTLASVCLDEEIVLSLIEGMQLRNAEDVKFARLKKSKSGRGKILKLIADTRLSDGNLKVSVFDKKFMMVTKIVDIIYETLAFYDGVDLYEKGANIAFSNLMFYAAPAFCGKDVFDRFLGSFVSMVRAQTKESKDVFFH